MGCTSFLLAFLSSDLCQAPVSDANQEPLHSSLKMLAKRRRLAVQVLGNERPHYRHLLCSRSVFGLRAAADEVEGGESDFVVCRSQSEMQRSEGGAALQSPGGASGDSSVGAEDAGPGEEVSGHQRVQRGQQGLHSGGEDLEGAGQPVCGAVALQQSEVRGQRLQEERPPASRPLVGQIQLGARGRLQLPPLLLDQTLVQLRATGRQVVGGQALEEMTG